MNQVLIKQLWQALKEAQSPYDYSIIFNHTTKKEIDKNEDQ